MSERLRTLLPCCATLLILLLAGWIYWPGQTGPIMLDDRSSVMVIGDLKQNPALARDYITGDKSGLLGRPVSMASFVLEKLYLDGSLATSKRVNILLHLFNGALVVWLFCLLFRHLEVPGYRWLAVLLGAAWILSPLYVSTVLYIVQRMAMLATTFMLLASIAYFYWREEFSRGRFSGVLLALVLACFGLAMFAKENAIVLVPVLLLVEALWFQFRDGEGATIHLLRTVTLGAIALGGLSVVVYGLVDYDSLAAPFLHRPFTLEERLLTQARILWDYVRQLLAPDVFGMGLYHDDFPISRSLTDPGSTWHAIMAWLGVLLLLPVLLISRWGRYLALGVTWFLVSHSVESTVLPLELYFEHRNYFPGMGLLLLIGVAFALAVRSWPQVRAPLLVYLSCYVLWLASLTGSQVEIWSSHPLLILNHLNGHPNSYRANADMAVQLANTGELDAARMYSDRAFSVSSGERMGDRDIRDLALSCSANRAVDPGEIDNLGVANPGRPFSSVVTLLTLVRMLQDDICPEFDRVRFADRMAEIFLARDSLATGSPRIYTSLAVLENTMQRWEIAEAYTDRFLEMAPRNTAGLLMRLHFATALGKVDKADAVKTLLQQMDDQGRLTTGERQTLSLYLEE